MSGSKAERRFARAVRESGLVPTDELARALEVQRRAAERGLALALDRILLKLELLDRQQILGLWRALRYYTWRKEDKFYVKLAVQSKLLTPELGKSCLREQKKAYKHEDQLVRVNEIARQRGYVSARQDEAIIQAMTRIRPVTLQPAGEVDPEEVERPSSRAARKGAGEPWRSDARRRDLAALRGELSSASSSSPGLSDEDLDALWDEADLDDVELDSQAVEIARASPLFEDSEDDTEELDEDDDDS